VRVRGGMGMGREARGKETTPTRKRGREGEEGCRHALKPPSGDVAENMQLFNQRQDQMHSCDAQAKYKGLCCIKAVCALGGYRHVCGLQRYDAAHGVYCHFSGNAFLGQAISTDLHTPGLVPSVFNPPSRTASKP
jgi:hypothetical protein